MSFYLTWVDRSKGINECRFEPGSFEYNIVTESQKRGREEKSGEKRNRETQGLSQRERWEKEREKKILIINS